YVALGRGGPKVSAIGLGMWQAGGKAWGSDVRDADCRKAMERAVELGINLVDTAEAYGDGHSETVMSRAIKNVGRDNVFVATKVGGWHLRPDDVQKACAASLKRLGVREIDPYQLHWPDPCGQVPLRQTMKALEALHRGCVVSDRSTGTHPRGGPSAGCGVIDMSCRSREGRGHPRPREVPEGQGGRLAHADFVGWTRSCAARGLTRSRDRVGQVSSCA